MYVCIGGVYIYVYMYMNICKPNIYAEYTIGLIIIAVLWWFINNNMNVKIDYFLFDTL